MSTLAPSRPLSQIPVLELMRTDLAVMGHEASVVELAAAAASRDTSLVVVIDDSHPGRFGTVSATQIAEVLDAPEDVHAGHLAGGQVVRVRTDQTVDEALDVLLDNGLAEVVVTDEDTPVGRVTLLDVLRAAAA